jgi:hypothetical protein
MSVKLPDTLTAFFVPVNTCEIDAMPVPLERRAMNHDPIVCLEIS